MAEKNNHDCSVSWTEQKLDAFEAYVKAYLTNMNKVRDRYKWRLLYFDGFAGSGTRSAEEIRQESNGLKEMFGEELVASRELQVYQGAAERVVQLDAKMKGFDFYYFVDKEEANCAALELKLSQYPTAGLKQFRPGDANLMTIQLANALRRDNKIKSLALLDPFGMSIDWNSIEAVSGRNVDLWILIPSGVIVNRLLTKYGGLMHPDRMVRIFGMPEEEIKQRFCNRKTEPSRFGDVEVVEKRADSIRLIAEMYVERLGELFPFVTPEPLVIRNKHNVPIYHLVCASFSQTALKIAQQIIC